MQKTGCPNQLAPCAHGAVRHPRWAQNVSLDVADTADVAVVENSVGKTEKAVDASDRLTRRCANSSARHGLAHCWQVRCCRVN
jgi:hypothetical protein